MPGAMQPRKWRRKLVLESAITTLALWQLRRTWFLLLFITFGMIAAVSIACAIPLLSNVMTTAGLRSTLRATPYSADIAMGTGTNGLSTSVVQDVHNQFDPLLHHYLGNAIKPDQFAIRCEDFSLYPLPNRNVLTIYGTSMQQAAPYMGHIQGHLAHVTGNPASVIEIMVTPDTAHQLGVNVGSTFKLAFQYLVLIPNIGYQQLTAVITARVAGLFSVTPATGTRWYGEDFAPVKFAVEGSTSFSKYTFLVSDTALLALTDHLKAAYHTDAIHTLNPLGYSLIWHYHLDTSQLDISQLNPLIDQLARIQSTVDSQYGYLENGGSVAINPQYPYLTRTELAGQALSSNGNPSILEEFRSRVAVGRIPTG